jgi:hypothetical protein
MVDSTRRQRLSLPVAPLVAVVLGGLIALAFALVPAGLLEDFVIDSGIAAVVPAAEPPLGFTARAVLILTAGGGTALIAWFGLFLLIGGRSLVVQRSGEVEDDDKAPVLRRADAHPDAPSRRPLSANRELGTPFLEVRAERPVHASAEEPELEERLEPVMERELPADLDTPLAAFDPRAIPDEPADWFPPPAPLLNKPRQQVFDPAERFETFELTPMVREAAPVREPALLREPVKVREPARSPEPVTLHAPEPIPEPMPEPMPLPEPVALREPVLVREPWPIAAPTPPLAADPWPIGAPTPPAEPIRPRASARVEVDPSASIHALLDRLERGVGMRETVAPPPPPPPTREESLQEALVTLRRLATRG